MVEQDLDLFPVSSIQRKLLLFDRLYPNTSVYNMPFAWRIKGDLDIEALEKAINKIISRHESLRTTFIQKESELYQVIHSYVHRPLVLEDLSAFPLDEQEKRLHEQLAQESGLPFNLENGPLSRYHLWRLSSAEFVFSFCIHHIVFDGWSHHLFLRELKGWYGFIAHDKPFDTPELEIQYADFSVWQKEYLEVVRGREVEYWRSTLQSIPRFELPGIQVRPRTNTFAGKTQHFTIPRAIFDKLNHLGQEENTTTSLVLLSALKLLLYKYSGISDITVGMPVAGRNRAELEHIIGFFVNTLVLRSDLSRNPSFRDLVARVREVALNAFAHQEMPFEALIEELQPRYEPGSSPFFQVMFNYQNQNEQPFELPGVSVQSIKTKSSMAKFDLTVTFTERKNSLIGKINYNSSVFDTASIGRLAAHLETLLGEIARNPDRRISNLSILSEAERKTQVEAWNRTTTDYPKHASVHELFITQARATPRAIAIESGSSKLTYEALLIRVQRLSLKLRERGVSNGMAVGFFGERSTEAVVGMLAILMAGAAYVPLDPSYPISRLVFIIKDTRLNTIVSAQDLPDELAQLEGIQVIKSGDVSTSDIKDHFPPVHAESQAYIMYTSGSTGTPKGIVVPHRAIVRLVKQTDYINLSPQDVVAQASNISFDAATFEIWGSLLNGARLVILDRDTVLAPSHLSRVLREKKVTVLFLTTALFNAISRHEPSALSSVRNVLFGGEMVDVEAVRKIFLFGKPDRLLHVYGPTESTTFATWFEIKNIPEKAQTIPIGYPITNTKVYVLDPDLNPVPVGVPGELFIGGDGIALEYLNRPELTGERFIHDPFASDETERMYRTGDLVRRIEDGSIEFIGRRDHQVKVRGFRIEMGEVESALKQHPSVEDCVVLAREIGEGDKELIAYIAKRPARIVSARDFNTFLAQRLPPYMIPTGFILLDSLPLTPNGKVDREALPDPVITTKGYTEGEQPTTPTESKLADIWRRILKQDQIGIDDSFFDLGGHSLIAVGLFAEIERVFSLRLAISTLVHAPTIRRLAHLIETKPKTVEASVLIPIKSQGSRSPLYCFHEIGATVMGYAQLAKYLDPDQPVFGLEGQGLDGDPVTDSSTETMAVRYADLMCEHRSEGSFLLAGFCYGGLIALAVAHELQKRGREVSLVALIESTNPKGQRRKRKKVVDVRYTRYLQRLRIKDLFGVLRQISFSFRFRMLRARRFLYKHIAFLCVEKGFRIPPRLRPVYAQEVYQAIISQYRPPEYLGRGAVFRCSRNRHPDPALGWKSTITGRLDIYKIQGGHFLLREPSVRLLGSNLQKCINDVLYSSGSEGLDTAPERFRKADPPVFSL